MRSNNSLGGASSGSSFEAIIAGWFGVAPAAVRMVTNGVNKTLRVVSDHNDAFARFSPTSLHSREDLESEAALIVDLGRHGAPCCQLIEIDGNSVSGPETVNGIAYNVLLTRAIPGRALRPTAQDARAFGKSLAQVHRAPLKELVRILAINSGGEIDPALQPVFRDLSDLVDRLSTGSAKFHGICHGDAWLGNAVNSSGKAMLFDFEYSGHGPLAYDIATYIWALQAETLQEETAIFASFVEGYRGEHDADFSADEIRLNLLRKEINNIQWLCRNIPMSREIKRVTAKLARKTLDFVEKGDFCRFVWT